MGTVEKILRKYKRLVVVGVDGEVRVYEWDYENNCIKLVEE